MCCARTGHLREVIGQLDAVTICAVDRVRLLLLGLS
jgi:hypothetical protein